MSRKLMLKQTNGILVVRNFSFGRDDHPIMGVALCKKGKRINMIPVAAIDLLVTTRISKMRLGVMVPEEMLTNGFDLRDVLGVIPEKYNRAQEFLHGGTVTEIPKDCFRSARA